jgi:hypothetical protein
LVAAVICVSAAPAAAATLTVTTIYDEQLQGDHFCSLREAINTITAPPGNGDCPAPDPGPNTIILGGNTYTLGSLTSAPGRLLLLATHPVTISGQGPPKTVIDASLLHDQALAVGTLGADASVTISHLTLTGAHAPDGGGRGTDGMGCTSGTCAAGGQGHSGTNGGAILNDGLLNLTDVALTNNSAGSGGLGGTGGGTEGSANGGAGGAGGGGGSGGAINNTGTLTLLNAVIRGNHAGSGGPGGTGGSIGFANSGTAGAGGGGGSGGIGGGIANNGGSVTITDSTIADNVAGSGGAGGTGGFGSNNNGTAGGGGAGGCCGDGGGIANLNGTVTISGSTFNNNFAGDGGAGGTGGGGGPSVAGANGGAGFGGSWGGGISSIGGSLSVTNTTVSGNGAGTGGIGGTGGDCNSCAKTEGNGDDGGAGGNGGGIRVTNGTSTLLSVTVADNAMGSGGAGGPAGTGSTTLGTHGGKGPSGVGGGVFIQGPAVTSQNTIAASNGGQNCSGPVTDGGFNLSFGDASCPNTFASGDPKLGPLQDNGGPTQTMALNPNSAAIDQGKSFGLTADQRGDPRPVDFTGTPNAAGGDGSDIGAFELQKGCTDQVTPSQVCVLSVTGASQSSAIWRGAKKPVQISRKTKPPVGTVFSFTLNESARITFTFTRLVKGRKVHGRCQAQTSKNEHNPRCTRRLPAVILSFTAHPGTNKVRFYGQLPGGKRLRPGSYTVVITATNAGQPRSVKPLKFTIVK